MFVLKRNPASSDKLFSFTENALMEFHHYVAARDTDGALHILVIYNYMSVGGVKPLIRHCTIIYYGCMRIFRNL